MIFDSLEPRRLLSINFADGVIAVDGTADGDSITVGLADGIYTVRMNGESRQFNRADVKFIAINSGGHNDSIELTDPFATAYGAVPRGGFANPDLDQPVNARLDGGGGDDWIVSGGGSDTLIGGKGRDSLQGQGGSDELFGGDGGADWLIHPGIAFGVRIDIDDQSDDEPVLPPPDLSSPTIFRPYTDNAHRDIENILGTEFNDELTGSDAGNGLFGRAGNDFLRGMGGNDTLLTDDGADNLLGGDGFDTIDYSARTSFIAITLDNVGNDGSGFVDAINAVQSSENDNVHADIERVWAGADHDHVAAPQFENLGNYYFDGGKGDDTLLGGVGDDTLLGGRGRDQLSGGQTDPVLPETDGNDSLIGGPHDDRADYSHRAANLVLSLNGARGDGAGEDDFISADVEILIGGSGDDHLIGNGDPNTLIGNGGADSLDAGGGRDWLIPASDIGDDAGNVIDGSVPAHLPIVANPDARDVVLNIARATIYGVLERHPGQTTWILRRGDNFTFVDPNGHTDRFKKHLGQWQVFAGNVETRENSTVIVIDWG